MNSGIWRKLVPGIVVLALALSACGGGEAGQETANLGSYTLPGEQVFPEGIAYQAQSGDFFVGSTTDGTVYRGNTANEGEEAEVFLEPGSDGRETAVGMKLDAAGRLFIAGGDTGRIFVYDSTSGDIVETLDTPESEMTFINDIAVVPNGDAYFTDSMRPALFRVPVSADGGVGEPEEWLDLEGTPVDGEGFNLNGIAATQDGRYLITVQSNTGNLYRIDTGSREIV
jgi:Cu-Zn family superoxide dismutase